MDIGASNSGQSSTNLENSKLTLKYLTFNPTSANPLDVGYCHRPFER